MSEERQLSAFEVKDCALIGICTGRRAQSLRELRDILQDVHPHSIYYHFWGHLLRPRFDNPEYTNDFATWAHDSLHDRKLAEQLAVIDPADFDNLEALRQELIDVIEERMDESETVRWASVDEQFHFIRSQIVVFNTRISADNPAELAALVPTMSLGSIFYHTIDARTRDPRGSDDFVAWMADAGEEYESLCLALNAVDPYFSTLSELRLTLAEVFGSCLRRDAS